MRLLKLFLFVCLCTSLSCATKSTLTSRDIVGIEVAVLDYVLSNSHNREFKIDSDRRVFGLIKKKFDGGDVKIRRFDGRGKPGEVVYLGVSEICARGEHTGYTRMLVEKIPDVPDDWQALGHLSSSSLPGTSLIVLYFLKRERDGGWVVLKEVPYSMQ